MSDRFHPLATEALVDWIFGELEARDSIFGIPRALFFTPHASDPFRRKAYGTHLHTPIGVAAGPHSQMAQNIVVAWLCGARFIELKTVQTLDELEVPKPCIDVEDEGYNVEWSQELKVQESYEEYLRAWVLIHALHRELQLPGDDPGVIFNLSVGYDHAGLQQENMRWYLGKAKDAGADLARVRAAVRRRSRAVDEIEIPSAISNSVTLSTMHGCPPGEIGVLCRSLMEEHGLHTSVKLNPTLLGPTRLRGLLNDSLGFRQIEVPDEAFGHDLEWEDGLPLLRGLLEVGAREGLTFGVKLSNTLEVKNNRTVFDAEQSMMYLSGRPLQALTISLAEQLQDTFDGSLYLSYAGGADAFNVAGLLRSGMQTVTVCSDLLKSGGYLRLPQYLQEIRSAMGTLGATSLDEFVRRSAQPQATTGVGSAPGADAGSSGSSDALKAATQHNLHAYAQEARVGVAAKAGGHLHSRSKTQRSLGLFDCIEAPCIDNCAIDQQVPSYLRAVAEGRYEDAVAITLADNAMASSLGRACDHKCELTCVRTHYDEPLAIRQIKRFIMDQEPRALVASVEPGVALAASVEPAGGVLRDKRVAIIGAGPCGLSAATFLARAGYPVTLFEAQPYAGGMVSGTIPVYRTPQDPIDADLQRLHALGAELRFGQRGGRDFLLEDLKQQGYAFVLFAAGAQKSARLDLPEEDSSGILPGLDFLRAARHGEPPALGDKVLVIGGGDVAMDCARTALRLGHGEVRVVYRRTREQMPGQKEEVDDFIEEGGLLEELLSPAAFEIEQGRLRAMRFERMRLGARGADGRRSVQATGDYKVLEASAILIAIGQQADLSFFGDALLQRTRKGLVVVEPETGRTNLEGVYAGGDVVNEGPDSIVAALEAGRRVAWDIRRREEADFAPPATPVPPERSRAELLLRRATRVPRQAVPHLPAGERSNFSEVIQGYDAASAQAEAARCLDCDSFCSLCVSVCPNLAFFTYEMPTRTLRFPLLRVAGGRYLVEGEEILTLEQTPQVAVLTDFCNECGNCNTFCPTAGVPYQDKPRIYLEHGDYALEADNAFYASRSEGGHLKLAGRFAGEEHVLDFGGELRYRTPKLTARLRPDLSIVELKPKASVPVRAQISLRPAAILLALGSGLERMGYLPFSANESI